MKITVTKKDLLAALKADYAHCSRAEQCLLAQALKRHRPDVHVAVRYDYAAVDGVIYHLSKKALRLMGLFDNSGETVPKGKTLTAIRKMLPCGLVFRKQRKQP